MPFWGWLLGIWVVGWSAFVSAYLLVVLARGVWGIPKALRAHKRRQENLTILRAMSRYGWRFPDTSD